MLQQILRSGEWEQLAEPIRRAHQPEIERRGKFRIRRGPGLASRFLARIFRLPQTAAEVETRLLIVPEDGCEWWQRSFAGTAFRTLQSRAGDSMIERWGCIEVRFTLRVEKRCLRYEQTGAAFRAGRLCLPLARSLAPRVEARESVLSAESVAVSVKVTLPLIGLLIEYEGVLEVGQ
jgi:hypothetical protein